MLLLQASDGGGVDDARRSGARELQLRQSFLFFVFLVPTKIVVIWLRGLYHRPQLYSVSSSLERVVGVMSHTHMLNEKKRSVYMMH